MRVKCEEVMFKPINALTLRLSGGTTSVIPHLDKEEIVSLDLPNNITLSEGETIMIEKKPYKINIVEKTIERNKLYYDLKTAQRNKSSIFVLPMLGGNRHLMLYNKLLMNAFIGSDEDDNCIVLLYRFSRDPLFYKFEQALKSFSNFKRTYDPTPHFVIFVFNVPKGYRKDILKFKQGKYSKFTDIYKLKILDFHGLEVDSPVGQVLFRSDKRRFELEQKLGVILEKDSELFSIMEKKDEILNPNYYF